MEQSDGSDSGPHGPVAGGTPATGRQPPKDRGGRFFALHRDVWDRLWKIGTQNRMNLVTAYLVLLAGTGRDHRTTKWSARACEQHTGMGKPRAKIAIQELINAGLLERTEKSTQLYPEYKLPETPRDVDPIFLPVAFVQALAKEASMLRRVRETGDDVLLRLLIDLYGQTQLDATYGAPISILCKMAANKYPARNVFQRGVHTIWAVPNADVSTVACEFMDRYRAPGLSDERASAAFWKRIELLEKIGALVFECWAYDSACDDAEPLFPLPKEHSGRGESDDDVHDLHMAIQLAVGSLTNQSESFLKRQGVDVLLPLTGHRSPPSIRGVLRMRIEADTPGRRLSYHLRKSQIEGYTQSYTQLHNDAKSDNCFRPMRTSFTK